MAGRMGGHPDRLETEPAPELDELRRVLQLLVRLLRRKWITAQREQILQPRRAEAADDLAELEARMRHAGQVRHRREVGRVQQVDHDAGRSLARYSSAAIRDGDERRMERLEIGDGPRQQLLLLTVLRWKELERDRPPGSEEIGDPGHSRRV